ncbi:MAG: prepilin-type N-terminal cleavage/methylation domain-containing protein, partial [Acinetobacter sp.]|nr:prepilin-type N-terminal cleavage/methylation domain-containing protein [Acinetobacter sp.]
MKSQQGFTLIEVMIVIAIVAIIASIAAPRFQDTLQSQNLNAEAKELILLLNTARSQALTLRQEANVNINSDSTDSGLNFNWLPEEKNKIVEKNTKFTITF